MRDQIQAFSASLQGLASDNQIVQTGSPVVSVAQSRMPTGDIYSVYSPCVCFIAGGQKSVTAGRSTYQYRPGQFLMSSVNTPVIGRVTKASEAEPYLCLIMELDPSTVFEVLESNQFEFPFNSGREPGLGLDHVSESLFEALVRLCRHLSSDADSVYLAKLSIKEIIFHLLRTGLGGSVAQVGLVDSVVSQVSMAIDQLRCNYSQAFRVEDLARLSGMSVSAFHRNFKKITQLSPIQFQKQIRLQEARRLMSVQGMDVTTASIEVGYESISQFSREYARLFGQSPVKDIAGIKRAIDQ